jgi:hypothetical protein
MRKFKTKESQRRASNAYYARNRERESEKKRNRQKITARSRTIIDAVTAHALATGLRIVTEQELMRPWWNRKPDQADAWLAANDPSRAKSSRRSTRR